MAPGTGFPALAQGRSCRVRVGRQGVKQRGRRGHTHEGTGAEPRVYAFQVLIALVLDVSGYLRERATLP
jgi:hypothetical protein